MRLVLVISSLLAASNSVSAFAPASSVGAWGSSSALRSTVEAVSADEIKSRMEANISKMSEKDAASKALSKEVS
jgi:hypothetical protein